MAVAQEIKYVNTLNRIITQNVAMCLDTRWHDLNNNILVIGGSGAGKTYRFVGPNIMQMPSSFIVTDSKGEICRKYSGLLEMYGYDVKVINLLNARGMRKSTRYSPFKYIKTAEDVVKLVTNFMENTKKKDAGTGDAFWTDMAGLLLQAYFYYTIEKGVEVDGVTRHDFKGVMELVNRTRVEEDEQTGARIPSEIDLLFKAYEDENSSSLAVTSYNKAMSGAADTVRSIISTLNSRTTALQTKEILDLLSDDEIDIPSIGTKKTAVFCIIPDNDKTYNFLIGMLYSQMFQELYYQADFVYGGALPVHVTFMMDEFANVALPEDFPSLLSTMRSREISSIIIIQNMAQLKKLYEKDWESLVGCCDTLIYLGGNEKETHKYISEYMGKWTIDKKTTGITKGHQGSSSQNFDVLGRELMLPEEVRKMSKKKCLVFIRGFDPIIDDKYHTPEHPLWDRACELSKSYKFDARVKRALKKAEAEGMHLYGDSELRRIEAEQDMDMEEYETLCEIARIEGSEPPEKPARKIIELTPAELMSINIEDLDTSVKLDEKMIEENKRRIEEELLEKAREEEFARTMKEAGFSENAVQYFREINTYMQTEEILETFSPQMPDDMIGYLADTIMRDNAGSQKNVFS